MSLSHCLFKLGNFKGDSLAGIIALVRRSNPLQCLGVQHAYGDTGHRQFNRFCLERGLHGAQKISVTSRMNC